MVEAAGQIWRSAVPEVEAEEVAVQSVVEPLPTLEAMSWEPVVLALPEARDGRPRAERGQVGWRVE